MTHATLEPGLFCTSSALTDSFLLSPSPTLSGLWGVKIPGWLQCSSCLWHFKSCHLLHPGLVLMVSVLTSAASIFMIPCPRIITWHCPLLQCNLRPPQTFVTFIQTSCNPQETAPLVFFITEWNWILICDFFWQTLTRGETLCLSNIVSLIHLLFSSKCHPRPCWCHVEAQSGPNVTAVSCYIVYTEDITRAHQCGSPSQLPGAQVTNWCRNWIAPQETWLPISITLMEHNWRLALIEDSFQFCDTEDGWGRVIW